MKMLNVAVLILKPVEIAIIYAHLFEKIRYRNRRRSVVEVGSVERL